MTSRLSLAAQAARNTPTVSDQGRSKCRQRPGARAPLLEAPQTPNVRNDAIAAAAGPPRRAATADAATASATARHHEWGTAPRCI
eukprot:3230618-Lingulodinium_polyedra.AAC.1